jgi:hypothetical protein
LLTAPVRDLLIAASQGEVGLDHRFLQALLGRFDDATPELVKFGLEERDDPVSLEPLLIDLFRFSPSAEALPLLIDLVRRDPAEIADELVEAFCRLGEASIGPLLDLYKELGPERGSEVAFVLAALQSPDPRIQQLIEERPALGDDGFLLEVYGNRGATLEPYDIWSDYPDEAGPRFDVMSQDRLFHLAQNSADPEVRGRSWAHLESEQARSVMLSRLPRGRAERRSHRSGLGRGGRSRPSPYLGVLSDSRGSGSGLGGHAADFGPRLWHLFLAAP